MNDSMKVGLQLDRWQDDVIGCQRVGYSHEGSESEPVIEHWTATRTNRVITRHVVWTVIEYVGVFIVLFYLRHVWNRYTSERNHLCECLGAKDPSLGSNDNVRHSVYSRALRFGGS